MKSILKVLVLALSLTLFAVVIPKQATAQHARVSFQMFYDQLSPYGQWVDYQNYGYVWIPDVGSDFVPYRTDGQWVSTTYGWTWASDYDWGWAPFHYGRWDFDNNYGWFWVPGTDWGPAWVSWRRANGYYGWEPMGPGLSISLSFGRPYNSYNDHWNYVRYGDFDRPDINRYAVSRTYNSWMFRNSTVIRNTYTDRSRNATYVSGPSRSDVQRYSGRKVTPVTLRDNTRPGQNYSKGQLGIYRPQVQRNNLSGQRAAPSRINNLKDVKRPSERSGRATGVQPNGRQQPNTRPSQQQQNVRQQQQQKQQNDRQKQQNARSDQQKVQQQQQNTRAVQQKQQQQQQNSRQQQQNARSDQQKQQQQQQNARQQQQNARSDQQKVQQQQQNARQQQQNVRSNQQQQQQQQQNARSNQQQQQQQQQNARSNQQQQQQQQQNSRQEQQNARAAQQQQRQQQQQQQQQPQQQQQRQQQQQPQQQQQAKPQQQRPAQQQNPGREEKNKK